MGNMPKRADIVVIGGGIVGSAIAYYLARTGRAGRVVVVEPDPTYKYAATPAANGGIRQLFSLPENISMSQYGLDFFANFANEMALDGEPMDISFRRRGYLFISDDGDHKTMEANHRLQTEMGASVDLLERVALKNRFPSINTDDVAIAVHSPDDAWINAHAAMMGLRNKARSLGVQYVEDRVIDWTKTGGLARKIKLSSGETIGAECFVLSAGAWSADIGRMIGLELPVDPMSRESHYFVTRAEIETLPFIKAETHLAFGPEASGYAGGLPNWDQPSGLDFRPSFNWFEKEVWPRLAHRLPALESLKLQRSWSGHYARNYFDLNAIIGPWDQGASNVFMACGFSGHGIMHAPASGRAIAELILDDGFEALDLSAFSYRRIAANEPYREKGIV